MAHPMHLHHVPTLVVAKDGLPLDQPYWVDTLNVAPGERYSLLIMPNQTQGQAPSVGGTAMNAPSSQSPATVPLGGLATIT